MLVNIPMGFLGSPPGKSANIANDNELRPRVTKSIKGEENREENDPRRGERRRDVN
jgi:hypothetical protein